MDNKEHNNSLHVLMFPWLAHGHISPYLELAKKLSQFNFGIYMCSTPINLVSIKEQVCSKTFPSIQLVELHLPSIPNLPPHYHTTKSLPPHLMPLLMEAFDMAQSSFSDLLKSLKPDLLIYDVLQPWAPKLASDHKIPAVQFLTMGAASSSCFFHMYKNPSVQYPFASVYLLEHEYQKVAPMVQYNGDRFMQSVVHSSNMILIKSSREIEAKYIDYLSFILRMEVLPVGALVQEKPTTSTIASIKGDDNKKLDYFMSWLDKKGKGSTVFVSFGSEYFMSKEEIEETAHGLELSGVNFIWVIRFHEGDEARKVDEVLPQGFLERVGERGMVVEGWAPQVNILRHGSVGGFVSHCGWSSVIESLRYGVPLIAMPMQLDQPMNARLIVELGVGEEVKRTGEGKIDRWEMAKVVKEFVLEKRGENLKTKMKVLYEKMNSDGAIELVVEKLLKLCEKRSNHLLDKEK